MQKADSRLKTAEISPVTSTALSIVTVSRTQIPSEVLDLQLGQQLLSAFGPVAVLYVVLFTWHAEVSPLVPVIIVAVPGWLLFQVCRGIDR